MSRELLMIIDREAGEIIHLVASVRPSVRPSVKAGFKLFVTTWVPRFMQSVYVLFRQVGRLRSITLLIDSRLIAEIAELPNLLNISGIGVCTQTSTGPEYAHILFDSL